MAFPIPLPPPSSAASRWTTPRCGICGLYKKCKSPKMSVDGEGKRKILIVGEAPGETEDNQGKPFVGRAGGELEGKLNEVGINMREDCWLHNAIICRPSGNRTPTSEEISWCRPNLTKVLEKYKPNVILTVGRPALESVLSGIWKEDFGSMGRWVGWKIPCVTLNSWVVPTYHPSFILREVNAAKLGTPIETIFLQHLKLISKIDSKPYKKIPNYESQVELIMDTSEAAKIIRDFIKRGGPVAPDYETTCLKPDRGGAIFVAGVCWRGKRTISFPFQGSEVIRAWSDLMRSDNPKIGFNAKFEDRWTRLQKIPPIPGEKSKPIKMKVNNWTFDAMIGAHIDDNRRGICSLSFQTMINLGVGDYSSHISQYLEQNSSYGTNSIREAPLQKLMLYNALDCLFTYKVAKKQIRKLKLQEKIAL